MIVNIDRDIARAERKLKRLHLCRDLDLINNKLEILEDNKRLYHGRLAVPSGDADRHHRDG